MCNQIEKTTRKIFHDIHSKHLENKDSIHRFRQLINTKDLRVPDDFFHDKLCADFGCGSAVHGMYNLLNCGAKLVHGLDLDESFIPLAKKTLQENTLFNGRWHLDIGSITNTPYGSEYFDFVLCQGVIHHIQDEKRALEEIYRVLKKDGKALINLMGKGGILSRFYMELLRDEYMNNNLFTDLIDNKISPEYLNNQIDRLANNMEDDGSENYKRCVKLLDCLKYLLDEDFILSLKDRVKAPIYTQYSSGQITGMFKEAGFKSFYRISRRPTYNNIRKIFTSLYYDYEDDLAKLLYGEGNMSYVLSK